MDELLPFESEYRILKDELDEMRLKTATLKQIETTNETLRNRLSTRVTAYTADCIILEDYNDLKVEVELLQTKNANYMKSVIDLEDEQRRNATLKQQIEMYKRSIQELEHKLSAEIKRADKAEYDAKRNGEKLAIVENERDRLLTDRDNWKEAHNDLHMSSTSTNGMAGECMVYIMCSRSKRSGVIELC